METQKLSISQPITQKALENKLSQVKQHIAKDFTIFLQTLLIGAGYKDEERNSQHSQFLRSMQFCINQIGVKLRQLKQNISEELSKEEIAAIDMLGRDSGKLKVGKDMNLVLNLFNLNFPKAIKNIMIHAKFKPSDCNENHRCYIHVLSESLVLLTNMYCKMNAQSHEDNKQKEIIKAKKPITLIDMTDCDSPELKPEQVIMKDVVSSSSTISLVAETKTHFIYSISTSLTKMAMKVLKKNNIENDKASNKLKNELKVAKAFTHPSFRKSIQMTTYQNKPALLLDWATGIPIDWVKKFNLEEFLIVAREIVSVLFKMHMEHFIHSNLTSDHIIYEACSKSIKIIGCSSSSSFGSKLDYVTLQELSEKDLHFISPEQSGRANREIDFRSDFYSLGIIFYKMLTGIYPFQSENSLKLIHMHLLEEATPVHLINTTVPQVVSEMVSKLMMKDVTERYQSAKGIMHDLELLIAEYQGDEKLTNVALAQHDKPDTFLVPQKLYGQSSDFDTLRSAFERLRHDSIEIAFVSGDSGTGKSSLVSELYKPVAKRSGMFLFGKCDCYKSEPYGVLIQAIKSFCDDLLLKDKVTIANYKSRIIYALGEEGRVLTNAISSLSSIIGSQPHVAEAFGKEAKNRFYYVFIKFMKAICSVGSPLVLVVEDLQWVDSKSLELLTVLLNDKSISNLMVVGTYRQNEVDNNHPIYEIVHSTNYSNVIHIKLQNQDHEVVNDFVSDSLCVSPLESYPLASYIYRKTSGNPFYIKQMLMALHEQGSIYYCNESGSWKWDSTALGVNGVVGDVVDFLQKKMRALNGHVQQVLITASCLGNPFSMKFLRIIVNSNKGIDGALKSGMITQHKGSTSIYCFLHDKMQQAAFSLLPRDNSNKIFLYMGLKLWKHFSTEEIEKNIYSIANLFHRAIDVVERHEDIYEIVRLFLMAGKKAILSTAYKDASKYLDDGLKLLRRDSWKTHYELTLMLYDEAAKASYCVGNTSYMNALTEEISANARSSIDLVNSYSLQIKCYSDRRLYNDAIQVANVILEKIGEKLDTSLSEKLLGLEIENTRKLIDEKSNQEVLSMKEMKDERFLSIVMILNDIGVSAFYTNPSLSTLCAARVVQLTFLHGISKYSCLGFSGFGLFLATRGDRLGYRTGEISLILLKKTGAKEITPMIEFSFYGLIIPFFTSIHASIEPLYIACKTSLEVGCQEYALCNANTYCRNSFYSGKCLGKLLHDIEELQEISFVKTISFLSIHQAILNLLDTKQDNPSLLSGKIYDVKCCFDSSEKKFDVVRSLVTSCCIAYLFNDYSLALKYVKEIRPSVNFLIREFHHSIFLFYESLTLLANVNTAKNCFGALKQVIENIEKLKTMEKNSPENFKNKVCLIEAEMAKLCGNINEAEQLFLEATSTSKLNGFLHEEALANERMGMFYLEQKNNEKASSALVQAYRCYEAWGAQNKVHQLSRRFPLYFNQNEKSKSGETFEHLVLENRSQASVSILSFPSFGDFTQSKRIRFSDTIE